MSHVSGHDSEACRTAPDATVGHSVSTITTSAIAITRTMTFRLTALYVSIVIISGALIFIAIFYQLTSAAARHTLAQISSEASDLSAANQLGGTDLLLRLIEKRINSGSGRLYLVADDSGRSLGGNLTSWPPPLANADAAATFQYKRTAEGPSRLAAGVAVRLSSGRRLLVGQDLDAAGKLGRDIGKYFFIGFAGLAAFGLLGGFLASRFVLARIGTVTATAKSIMAGSFSERIPLSGSGDELDHLAANLNQLIARIEQLIAGMREVSDNIAHDLKTPLNRLRNRAEEALRADGSASIEDYRQALGRITDDADELIKTFNALLLIARLEAGAHEDSRTVVDIGALAQDVGEFYQPVAEELGRDIAVVAHDGLNAKVNRQLVGQAIANMLDNALKYGSPTSQAGAHEDIRLEVAQDQGMITVSVRDRGTGIPNDQKQNVLRRFFRLDASRNKPGTGLGLSLVSAVAGLSGGEVRLEDNHPGLAVILAIPCADDGGR